jgi:ABC-type nitrate/sulfonate/bicarbonate transport system substrate-binding protein
VGSVVSRVKWRCAVAASVAGVLAVAACGSGGGGGGGAGAGGSGCTAPPVVTVAVNQPINVLANRLVAQGTGVFTGLEKACHTSIQYLTESNGLGITNALVGGPADVAESSAVSAAKLEGTGQHVVVVFASFIGGGSIVVGAKKYQSSRGTDLAKYSGSTWGYPDPTGTAALYLQTAATKAGVNWSAQKTVAYGLNSAGLAVLQSGRLDIAEMDPSTAALTIQTGVGYMVLNTNDAKTAKPVIGVQIGSSYVMTKSFVDKYPVLTQMLVDGWYKALRESQAAASDPARVLALFPAANQQSMSKGWASSWALVAPAIMASNGAMSSQAVSDTLSFAERYKLLTAAQAAAAASIFDNKFIDKAMSGH